MVDVRAELRAEAEAALLAEPLYAGIIQATIPDQRGLARAMAHRLAHRLGDGDLARLAMRDLCLAAFEADPHAGAHAVRDLIVPARVVSHIPRSEEPALTMDPFVGDGIRRRPEIPTPEADRPIQDPAAATSQAQNARTAGSSARVSGTKVW